jgi:hypothetical protein
MQKIKFIRSYSHSIDGNTGYSLVKEDNKMFWKAPGQDWESVSTVGIN